MVCVVELRVDPTMWEEPTEPITKPITSVQ